MADTSQVKEITSRLEQGVKDLFASDTYADYLKTMSRFHQYSTRNTVLIHTQKPDATLCCGFRSWQSKFGRHVKKGEKAIKILAPTPFVVKEEKEKLDPDTRLPVLDENGIPIVEETERRFARFKVTSIFDISQTDGKPLPSLVQDLTGNVEQYAAFMDALRTVSPLPIVFEPLPSDTDGTCHFGDRISIREGMSEIQTVSAVIHEITHAKLHDLTLTVPTDESVKPKDRRTEEVEAESVSFSVCAFFGIETDANSFGYILEWSKNRDLKELNASLDTIRKTAADLIDAIDGRFREIAKDRDITFAIGEEQTALAEPEQAVTEQISAAEPTITEPSASVPEPQPILAEYARAKNDLLTGANVLMTPVFDEGNFNRSGKKIRVTILEPAGKYQLFSHDENGDKALYFMTASGRIDRTAEYFRDEWDEQQRKYVNIRPTEAELDEVIPQIAAQFERDMTDPAKWAKYQHAAVLNRLDECETHNVPVRELREQEATSRREEQARDDAQERLEKHQKFDARVDEIADAIQKGKIISVAYDEYEFDSNNPVLDLFRLYGIDVPLRTQGWVNTGLAEITESGYRYFSSKHKRNSTTFGGCLAKLREAIRETPIEQRRRNPADKTEVTNPVEQALYKKLSELFPDFMDGKYSYLRLEAGAGMEPLSLEWIFGDRLSVMHTYELNGDLCYDPMIEFIVNSSDKTLSAAMFQQSIPPLYQYIDDNGIGRSVDGNGNTRIAKNLRSELHDFSSQWFQNIGEQGYIPAKANLVLGEDNEVRVTFDKDGNMIMPEPEPPETPEKQYDLGYDFLGNGITVWNRADEVNGDYATVAHIDPDRTVTIYDKNMPEDVKERIEKTAQSPDTWAFGLKPAIEPGSGTDLFMPDPSIGFSEMNLYGYAGDGMLPLMRNRAVELFDADNTVYLLYTDNTEAMALDREEIINHDGLYGIEREEWETSSELAAMKTAAKTAEGSLEADLLYGNGDSFGIYQLKRGDETRDYRFEPLDHLHSRGFDVDRKNYDLVYVAPLDIRDTQTNLHKIYNTFNTERPDDFKGRSVSVSDTIVLQWRGSVSSHYVDDIGFTELPAFLGAETQKAQTVELPAQTYSQVGNALHEGRPGAPKGRPSLMERLEQNKQKAARQGHPDANKVNDREV